MTNKLASRIIFSLLVFQISLMFYLAVSVIPMKPFNPEEVHILVEKHDQRLMIAKRDKLTQRALK